MTRPAVLVLAVPHELAVEIGDALRARDTYEVVVPDLEGGESPAAGQAFGGVISTMSVPGYVAEVVVELPHSLDQPLKVSAGGISVWMAAHVDDPIEDAISALDGVLLHHVTPSAMTSPSAAPRPPRARAGSHRSAPLRAR